MANLLKARALLNGISFDLDEGEKLVVLGPSGSGKSRLLELLAGRELADARQLARAPELQAQLVTSADAARLPDRRTVRAAWARALGRLDADSLEARIRAVSEALELGPLMDCRVSRLSLGERSRVALGLAWVQEPRLLLLDEPFAAIAGPLRRRIRRRLLDWSNRNARAVVIATQESDEAMCWDTKVISIHQSRAIQQGSARELYEDPAARSVAENFGVCFIEGRLDLRDGHRLFAFADGETEASLPLDFLHGVPVVPGAEPGRGSIVLGVRPESVRAARNPDAPETREELPELPELPEQEDEWLHEAARPGQHILPGWEAPPISAQLEALEATRLRLRGRVLRSEWRGAETWLEIQAAGRIWSIKASAESLRSGHRCWLELPRENLLWFDAQGERFRPLGSGEAAEPAPSLALEDQAGTRGLKTRAEVPESKDVAVKAREAGE